ncbi:MAG: tRNA 2-thiouridine(34) synthase MnmA [Desulfobacteraceae bacterium 4572_88]|nr:MAG: tRNA 2-thiouridine(34) synthase MnmA [Desulfobacteraceae bacterium 4572_88]
MNPDIAIAVSGGIDSLVAAQLLKEQGHEVIGIHFLTGYETPLSAQNPVEKIGEQIGIRVETVDCGAAFQSKVVDYFTQTYLSGQTPNPCLVCNPSIKFGTLLSFARELGASSLATGHYARIRKDRAGHFHLLRGLDQKKDQSYFLSFLSQKQLAAACFPLGEMSKPEVIQLAARKNLIPVEKGESQDVCFIRGRTYGEFLAEHQGVVPKPGAIEDVSGNVIGQHKGLHLFTIGQRRGINCPASEPYYVVQTDMKKNRLVVGFKKELFSSECQVTGINWIHEPPASPVRVLARLRYRHQAAPAILSPTDPRTAIVRFETPQTAITPGQGAVFYQKDEVLGGGWIEK